MFVFVVHIFILVVVLGEHGLPKDYSSLFASFGGVLAKKCMFGSFAFSLSVPNCDCSSMFECLGSLGMNPEEPPSEHCSASISARSFCYY